MLPLRANYRLHKDLGLHVFCALLQAKHMIMLKDSVAQEVIQFLEHCEGTYELE